MNKNKTGRKFGRKRDGRKALLRSLANALILHGKIRTTEPKAKELRNYIEPIISRARKDTVSNHRLVARELHASIVKQLFSVVAPRYRERKGGYTRIIRQLSRKTDAAKLAVIELI